MRPPDQDLLRIDRLSKTYKQWIVNWLGYLGWGHLRGVREPRVDERPREVITQEYECLAI